jgi:hypothetical protein
MNEQIAWAAGFFEGEGGVYVGARTVKLCVVQADREPLERFRAIFGVEGNILSKRPNPPGKKTMYAYYVQRRDQVEVVVEQMWPWLGPRKREQIRVALTDPRGLQKRLSGAPGRLAFLGLPPVEAPGHLE